MNDCFSEGPVSPDGSSPPRATTDPSEIPSAAWMPPGGTSANERISQSVARPSPVVDDSDRDAFFAPAPAPRSA